MRTLTPALQTLLSTADHFYRADLYTITLIDGTVIRTTDADRALVWDGSTFDSCTPPIRRARVRRSLGVSVDNLRLDVSPSTTTIGGRTWAAAARVGAFDGAQITVTAAYLSEWPTIVGVLSIFTGFVSTVEPSSAGLSISVKSALEAFRRPVPRNVYQTTCANVLYDNSCGVSRAAQTRTGTITAASTVLQLFTSITAPDTFLALGSITFTSGANVGQTRTIRSQVGGTIRLLDPLLSVPAIGDTFSALAGCDRALSTCRAKFNNAARFRGFPFVPVPETTF